MTRIGSLPVLERRARCLRLIREFFWARRYREIDTPLLSPVLIPESTIDPFTTTHVSHLGEHTPLALVPSPEIWMKRLLAAGSGDLFQLSHCFRNGEPPTGLHRPEFTMLEWYTVNAGYLDSLMLQEQLFEFLRRRLKLAKQQTVRGQRMTIVPPFRRITMREAFLEFGGVDLAAVHDYEALTEAAARAGVQAGSLDDWESLFHKVFLQEIEPRLPADRPLFLLDYPDRLPTLARRIPGQPFVERWELYAAGVELANCYTEERDPERIGRFFREESAKLQHRAKTAGRPPVVNRPPVDWDLADLIARELPPCSGNALGVDRLLMVLQGSERIDDVLPFPDLLTAGPEIL